MKNDVLNFTRHDRRSVITVFAVFACLLAQTRPTQAASHTLSREVLRDKIRGAWAGQMIGVTYGAPTEFQSKGKIHDDPIKPAVR